MYPDTYQNKEDDESIYWFSSPFDALNNWSAHALEVYGSTFHTLEHAYHYKKFVDKHPEIAELIKKSPSPWAAMQIARENSKLVRKDWGDVKVSIMQYLVRVKLEQNIDVQQILAKTGDRQIVENSPWDSFWGCGPDGKGENTMGKIWMKVRENGK
jgi:ribA/ribD-fused uncharacterized protein